ncbi:MFS transporter [Campylobacter sp. RM12642]|uniref:MFS transporter n=1 Tax=unclassified Campylobacter TaxID=2593542 RepID=UPI001BDA279F|nr:MFS transporter [Campylobacter sp. 2018MI01]MBT0878799.1 MFS transporter [Campylobacter sp. 2018MI01]MBZ7979204.1 MFS transporter [Campylobacter sp. RM12642]MBZ8007189.1 MFS transporter [Campylobacter sp. RM9334]
MKNRTRTVIAASMGNALEWYDFSLFAFFAVYISANFFPKEADPITNMINTFLLFGVGFIARPIGAILCGYIGDKYGRKKSLLLTISTMAIGIIIIVLTPKFQDIGYLAPIMLLVARLFQGFSAGGEIGGATSYLLENADKKQRLLYASFLQSTIGIANILSALAGVIITTIFTTQDIYDGAWKYAFAFGLLIIPIGVYIRNKSNESAVFIEQQKENKNKAPLKDLLKDYKGRIFTGMLFSTLWTAGVYSLIIFMPTFYHKFLGYDMQLGYTASFLGNIFLTLGCFFAVFIAHKIGLIKSLMISIGLLSFIPFLALYVLLGSSNAFLLFAIHIILCLLISFFVGLAPAIMSLLFPAHVRSSGLSISYNLVAIFFAGFTPAIITYLAKFSLFAPAAWTLLSCILAFWGVVRMKKLGLDNWQEF